MTVYAGKELDSRKLHQGVVVPSAAVWMGEGAGLKSANKRHVRTIDCSNGDRFHQPSSLRILPHSERNYRTSQQLVREQDPENTTGGNSDARSIKESLKQWAGGGLFGLVIFAGILLSQSGEEEVSQNYYETQMVGVSLGR